MARPDTSAFSDQPPVESVLSSTKGSAISSPAVGESDTTKDAQLDIPAGALVESAFVIVDVRPGGPSPLAEVAVVRATETPAAVTNADDRSAFVIDFQRMRTVQRIRCNVTIHAVLPWLGTQFAAVEDKVNGSDDDDVTFPEVQTERLLVVTQQVVSMNTFTTGMLITLPAPPTDLELLVNGKRAWFRPGPVRAEVVPPLTSSSGDFFKIKVDLTAEVQAAVLSSPTPVTVTLKAATPGQLSVTPNAVSFLRVHAVAFPEGETRTLVTESEGLFEVSLPIAPATGEPAVAAWQIHGVQMVVAAQAPPTRVVPASGPDISSDAELTLDPEHAAVTRLPPSALDQFATLAGVRLPVLTGAGGAELAGVLRADVDGEPGPVIAGPSLGPISVEPTPPGGPPRWVSLLLPRPRKLTPQTPLWVAVQVSRGQVTWPVTVPEDPDPPGNPLRRGLPAGPFRALPTLGAVAPHGFGAVIRVVGEEPPDAPLPAVRVWIEGASSGAAIPAVPDGRAAALEVDPPLAGSDPDVVSDGALRLQVEASTAGTFKFRSVQIIYR